MPENKTIPSNASVTTFLDGVEDPVQRRDAFTLLRLFGDVSGEPATLWGPAIVGFGKYHYRYDSGREGDFFRIGFSPRKGKLSLYFYASREALKGEEQNLGKFTMGKSCLYIKRLDQVNLDTLARVAARSYELSKSKYPTDS